MRKNNPQFKIYIYECLILIDEEIFKINKCDHMKKYLCTEICDASYICSLFINSNVHDGNNICEYINYEKVMNPSYYIRTNYILCSIQCSLFINSYIKYRRNEKDYRQREGNIWIK